MNRLFEKKTEQKKISKNFEIFGKLMTEIHRHLNAVFEIRFNA